MTHADPFIFAREADGSLRPVSFGAMRNMQLRRQREEAATPPRMSRASKLARYALALAVLGIICAAVGMLKPVGKVVGQGSSVEVRR